MKLTRSTRYNFKNWYGSPAYCWLRVYEGEGRVPVVIATEMTDNPGISVTNYAEELATEVRRMLNVPQIRWIEHYPPRGRKLNAGEEFDLVEFQDSGGAYVEPDWTPLTKHMVEIMVGEPLEDMQEGEPRWLHELKQFLRTAARDNMTPVEVAAMIHEGLVLAEAEKYAEPETKFAFTFSHATRDDVEQIRRHLTPFENGLVEIRME